MAVDYTFYISTYLGDSIPPEEFPRLSMRATAQLSRYKRIYAVTGEEGDESLAICAMADALYYFETVLSGGLVTSSSVGSVSSSAPAVTIDVSEKAQAKELYRYASLYLTMYRGGSR